MQGHERGVAVEVKFPEDLFCQQRFEDNAGLEHSQWPPAALWVADGALKVTNTQPRVSHDSLLPCDNVLLKSSEQICKTHFNINQKQNLFTNQTILLLSLKGELKENLMTTHLIINIKRRYI